MQTRHVLAFLASASAAFAASPLGLFEDHGDIGAVKIPGSASYDAATGTYSLSFSGTNMWGDHDEFQGAWRQLKGDFLVQAEIAFEGPGTDPHRKAGITIRSSLDPKAAHVNACRHGDGLTSLQFRRATGATTEEKRFELTGADVLQIERIQGVFRVSVARRGQVFVSQELSGVDLGDSVFVALYGCAHNNQVVEKAKLHNVRLIRPAKPDFKPYRDYIGSDVEVMNVTSGVRTVVHHEDDSIQAPNWTPDGKTFIMNHNGRIVSLDLASRVLANVDTGDVIQNNNDHALSWGGAFIGLSSGQPSRVYTVPIHGGKPTLVTPTGPSYLHGWSPDNQFLVYTANRDGDYEIFRTPVKGGTEEQLTHSKGLDDGSEYSPDGKYIYFISERTGRMQLWRMNADGSNQIALTHDDFNNWFPHISPDGKRCVFITYGPEIPANDHPFYKHVYLREIPLDGGEPKVIAYLYGGQGSMNVNSWSPDSENIAFIANSDKL